MNALDIIIALILLIGATAGAFKGFISQIFAIFSILLSVWLSFTSANALGEWLSQYISASEVLLKAIGFLLILIGVGILCKILGRLLEKLFQFAMLGWLNRILGAVFSCIKYALILGIIILLFDALNQNFEWVQPEVLAKSWVYSDLQALAEKVFPYFQKLIDFQAA